MQPSRKLIAEILRTAHALKTSRDALLAGWGMTGARLRIQKTVRRIPIPITVPHLARLMNVSRQATLRVVRQLEREGFVTLEVNVRHRKSPHVVLTSSGRQHLETVLRIERQWVKDLTRNFSDQEAARTAWLIWHVRRQAEE